MGDWGVAAEVWSRAASPENLPPPKSASCRQARGSIGTCAAALRADEFRKKTSAIEKTHGELRALLDPLILLRQDLCNRKMEEANLMMQTVRL